VAKQLVQTQQQLEHVMAGGLSELFQKTYWCKEKPKSGFFVLQYVDQLTVADNQTKLYDNDLPTRAHLSGSRNNG
jgi:hypothetical protein